VIIQDKVCFEDFCELPHIELEDEVTIQQESMLVKLTPEHLETQSNANKSNKKLEVPSTYHKSKSPKVSGGRTL